jgi:hypothetical protein
MNDIELTKLFIEYREVSDRLRELEAQIQEAVMALESSQKIAGVRATYYKPTQQFDYEGAASAVDDDIIAAHSTLTRRVRWAEVCAAVGIDPTAIPSAAVPARVVVKLA